MLSWSEVKELLSRSYTYRLLEAYIDQFDQKVYGKLDFSLLANRQEAFDHLFEVFEQDLRLGEELPACEQAKNNPSQFLRASIVALLLKSGSSLDDNLALKGMLEDGDIDMGTSWSAE